MIIKKCLLGLTLALSTSSFAFAGPAAALVVEKVVEKAGNTAVAITNSVTGGVTSHKGKVTTKGKVVGGITQTASGENAETLLNVGGAKKTTAEGDINAEGTVVGGVTQTASGKNSKVSTLVGGTGE